MHIGITTDTPQELIVPSIKYVSRKSILEISVELDALIEKETKGQLTRDDLFGTTITHLATRSEMTVLPIIAL